MTTGDGHWASGTKVWFVMIKDAEGRSTPATRFGVTAGDGRFSGPMSLTSRSRRTTKKTSRAATSLQKATDWVYINGYRCRYLARDALCVCFLECRVSKSEQSVD